MTFSRTVSGRMKQGAAQEGQGCCIQGCGEAQPGGRRVPTWTLCFRSNRDAWRDFRGGQ